MSWLRKTSFLKPLKAVQRSGQNPGKSPYRIPRKTQHCNLRAPCPLEGNYEDQSEAAQNVDDPRESAQVLGFQLLLLVVLECGV